MNAMLSQKTAQMRRLWKTLMTDSHDEKRGADAEPAPLFGCDADD